MIDRWLVVEDGDGKVLAEFSSWEWCREASRLAFAKQDECVAQGISTQVYHERHVLIKEPVSWKRGF